MKSCQHNAPGFWSLFALSLGLSLLMTALAVGYQRSLRPPGVRAQ